MGEIRDEYDAEEEEMLTELVPGQEYRALGSAKLDDLNEILHTNLESEDYDSIGGYIIEQLDRLPAPGESTVTPGAGTYLPAAQGGGSFPGGVSFSKGRAAVSGYSLTAALPFCASYISIPLQSSPASRCRILWN